MLGSKPGTEKSVSKRLKQFADDPISNVARDLQFAFKGSCRR